MTKQETRPEGIEVNWPVDDMAVYGTLVQPAGPGPFPAVVMVAGSGPTDRDWNSPLIPGTNGSARLLADALAERGFASLRYDKRASGPHLMENIQALIGKVSFQSHVDELAGAVRFLAARDGVDPKRIFALGNSEGCLHVLNYQVNDVAGKDAVRFAGIVLTAPPGRPMGEVGRSQVLAQLSGLPNSAQLIEAYDAGIAAFERGEAVTPDPGLPEGVQMLLMALSTPANQPFSRQLWTANLATWLARAGVPVLVMIGKKDIQVDWQADGGRLQESTIGHENVDFVYPEDANHVLKHEPGPRADLSAASATTHYNDPEAVLDPTALAAILGWLAAHS